MAIRRCEEFAERHITTEALRHRVLKIKGLFSASQCLSGDNSNFSQLLLAMPGHGQGCPLHLPNISTLGHVMGNIHDHYPTPSSRGQNPSFGARSCGPISGPRAAWPSWWNSRRKSAWTTSRPAIWSKSCPAFLAAGGFALTLLNASASISGRGGGGS
jgi:hypothetical protein